MENWRPIIGWNDLYEVSDFGRVRSVGRVRQRDAINRHRSWPAMTLAPIRHDAGYLMVTLNKNGFAERYYVHRLVAAAFLGEPPFNGAVVNHLSGDKSDNRPANLEWTNHAGNARHARATGLWSLRNPSRGESHHRARLCAADVLVIRARYDGGESPRSIARDFPVSVENIKAVAYRKTWRHVA